MAQAYSGDLRSRVIKAAADGMSARQAAAQREDVLQARQTWFDGQLDLDPDKLIFSLP